MNGSLRMMVKENWLTAPAAKHSRLLTIALAWLLFALSSAFFLNLADAQNWMAASGEAVFERHEYWRLWSTLFAHGDLGHLLGNAFLFVPLSYLLVSHYSLWFFPVAGMLLGGAINWLVLKTMPSEAYLIGISGVVYWMGAAWLTLYLLIDRRDRLRRRMGAALFLTLMLFVPETLRPEVSHLSHLLGYVMGIASALLYYLFERERFHAAEVREYIFEPEEEFFHEREAQANLPQETWQEEPRLIIHN